MTSCTSASPPRDSLHKQGTEGWPGWTPGMASKLFEHNGGQSGVDPGKQLKKNVYASRQTHKAWRPLQGVSYNYFFPETVATYSLGWKRVTLFTVHTDVGLGIIHQSEALPPQFYVASVTTGFQTHTLNSSAMTHQTITHLLCKWIHFNYCMFLFFIFWILLLLGPWHWLVDLQMTAEFETNLVSVNVNINNVG